MGRWHNQYADGCVHFCTFAVQGWRPALDRDTIDILYSEWNRARERFGISILAYVVMPDHVHMLLWSSEGRNIRVFLQRTLGETSKHLSPGKGKFWKERPRVFPIYSDDIVKEKIEYIHSNPVRRGLAGTSAEWRDSSFRQLAGGEGTVPFRCDPLVGALG